MSLVCLLGAAPGASVAASAPALFPPTDIKSFRDASSAAEARRAARRERRDSVKERRDRGSSKMKHHKLDRAAARALAQDSFDVLAADVWAPLRLRDGENFSGYINDYSARIERAGEAPLIAKTFVPMRAKDSAGVERRVSLKLRRQGTAITPANALVDMSIAAASDGPVRLEHSGVSVSSVGLDSVEGAISNDRVYAENVATDFDQIVQATPLGAQFMWQVRSAESRESVRLRFGLPAGARLRLADNELMGKGAAARARQKSPPQAVEVVDGDEVIARVEPPVTLDSDGASVETFYELMGNAPGFKRRRG